MEALKIVKVPDPILRTVCDKTASIEEIAELGKAMLFTMNGHIGGIGLAAPQVGSTLNMFVMHMEGVDEICYQPKILWKSDKKSKMLEGCLSLPSHITKSISRPSRIKVSYINKKGETVERSLSHIEAKCYQHELDHLRGVLITDYR